MLSPNLSIPCFVQVEVTEASAQSRFKTGPVRFVAIILNIDGQKILQSILTIFPDCTARRWL